MAVRKAGPGTGSRRGSGAARSGLSTSKRKAANRAASVERQSATRINLRGKPVKVEYAWSPRNADDRARDKTTFLRVFAETGSTTAACIAIKRGRTTVYSWRDQDEEFAAAWREIWETQVDKLEETAMQRAIHGYVRPVYQLGRKVGAERVFAPNLTMFMLSKLKRKQYSDVDEREAALAQRSAAEAARRSLPPEEYVRQVREAFAAQDEAARAAMERSAGSEPDRRRDVPAK